MYTVTPIKTIPGDIDPLIMDNAYTATSFIQDQMMAQYEKLVIELLRNILKREPFPEDAKDLSMIYMAGFSDSHDVAYKGAKIGTVTQNTDFEKGTMGWVFKPTE